MSPKVKAAPSGQVLVFTGDGKGKTTAAMGLALRLAGHGRRVLVVQFAKRPGGSGEVRALGKLGALVTVKSLGRGWLDVRSRPRRRKDIEQVGRWWEAALRLIRSGKWQDVVLDEAVFVTSAGFLPVEKVTAFLDERPPEMTVIMTGRGKTAELVRRADYVTEMKEIKHPFDKGRRALPGIEY
jgi:cob(I)alamin adenosyltransferase